MNFNDLPRVGRWNRLHNIESHQKRYTGLWVGIGSVIVGAGTSIYSTQQQKKAANKALDAQRGIAADITYEPIDIEALKTQAKATAIQNATNSLALERQLQPNVAATREELSRQISEDLKLGGQLPADVQNRVTEYIREGIGDATASPTVVLAPVPIDPPGTTPAFAAAQVTVTMTHTYLFLGPVSGMLGAIRRSPTSENTSSKSSARHVHDADSWWRLTPSVSEMPRLSSSSAI